jgi:hypothetical protein
MVGMLTRISYKTSYVSEVGVASLNMLFLMSAPTGGGKSASRRVASDYFEFEGLSFSSPAPIQAGSGEAIADAFYVYAQGEDEDGKAIKRLDWVNPNHCRVFYNDEISYHRGKAHQNSSTLEATYLSLYSGDLLGRSLAGGRSLEVPAGEYRAVAIFNAQPENDPFRSDAAVASGMPSRLLNLRAVNPNARADYEKVSSSPMPKRFLIRRLAGEGDVFIAPQYRALPEMEEAHAEEDFLASEGLREHGKSHTLLTRAKVACVLAALDSRTYLISEDWSLAGHLIDHSNEVDAEIKRTLNLAARTEAGKSGALLGFKLGAAEETKERYAVERVAKNLKRWAPLVGYDLTKPPTDPNNIPALNPLSGKISGRDRKLVDSALESLYEEARQSEKDKEQHE